MDKKERNAWLMSISESESFGLNMEDWYDRVRLIRQELAREHLLKVGYRGECPKSEKVSPRVNFEPQRTRAFYVMDK